MTATHLVTVAMADIVAIRLECEKCHAVLCLRLEGSLHITGGCPNCNEDWGSSSPYDLVQSAKTLADAVKTVRRLEENNPRVRVRFELVETVKP
jgi:hypothetical protein